MKVTCTSQYEAVPNIACYSKYMYAFNEFILKERLFMLPGFFFFLQVTLHATSLTLTALTIDRYHAIVNALSSLHWRTRRTSTIVSLLVWAGKSPYVWWTHAQREFDKQTKKGMREFRNFSQAGIRGIKLFAGRGIIFGNITMLN